MPSPVVTLKGDHVGSLDVLVKGLWLAIGLRKDRWPEEMTRPRPEISEVLRRHGFTTRLPSELRGHRGIKPVRADGDGRTSVLTRHGFPAGRFAFHP
jgi:hypothetical protein